MLGTSNIYLKGEDVDEDPVPSAPKEILPDFMRKIRLQIRSDLGAKVTAWSGFPQTASPCKSECPDAWLREEVAFQSSANTFYSFVLVGLFDEHSLIFALTEGHEKKTVSLPKALPTLEINKTIKKTVFPLTETICSKEDMAKRRTERRLRELQRRNYGETTVKLLKVELKKRGLVLGGNKAELVSRLRADDQNKKDQARDVTTIRNATTTALLSTFDEVHSPAFMTTAAISTISTRNTVASTTVVTTISDNFPTGIVGLHNLGNTCFMNSAIQCFLQIPSIYHYFATSQFQSEINLNNALGHNGEFIRSVAYMFGFFAWNDGNTHNPRDFYETVSRLNRDFSDGHQHDVGEFLSWVVDHLHEEVNKYDRVQPINDVLGKILFDRVAAENAWNDLLRSADSFFLRQFYGQYSSSILCVRCGLISTKYEWFSMLTIPIPAPHESSNLGSCLRMFVRPEKVHDFICKKCCLRSPLLFGYFRSELEYDLSVSTSWQFIVCSGATNQRTSTRVRDSSAFVSIIFAYIYGPGEAIKKLSLLRVPQTLIIALSRFDYSGKKETFVSFPITALDLNDVMALQCKEHVPVCDLIGISNHHGSSAGGGHCTAFVKHIESQNWYHLNDTESQRVHNPPNMITTAAYILTYSQRQESAEPVQMSNKFESILRAAESTVVSTVGNYQLKVRDLRRLDWRLNPTSNRWLNDAVVNATLYLIQKFNNNVWIANSHFYAKLMGRTGSQFNFDAVKRWTKIENLRKQGINAHTLFDLSRWIIPINWKNIYWILLLVHWKHLNITILDSFLYKCIQRAELEQIAQNIARFVALEHKEKASGNTEIASMLQSMSKSSWTLSINTLRSDGNSSWCYEQQSNTNDCGVRMLRAAELISKGKIPRMGPGPMNSERAILLASLVHNDFAL